MWLYIFWRLIDSFIHDQYGVGWSTIYYMHWAGDLVGIGLMVVFSLYIDDLSGPWMKRNGWPKHEHKRFISSTQP
jgi:hypothetical protein